MQIKKFKKLKAKKLFISLIFVLAASLPVFVIHSAALAAPQNVTFNVDSVFDKFGSLKVNGILLKEGTWAYYYIDSRYWDTLNSSEKDTLSADVNLLSQEFDANIYSKLTQFWGGVWSPGIDNDPKVTILLTLLAGSVTGYINTGDEIPKTHNPDSNEREIIYLSVTDTGRPLVKAYLAHEFQHLIAFNQKNQIPKIFDKTEDVWINEVRSEYSPTILGYDDVFEKSNIFQRLRRFLEQPSDSLTEWIGTVHDYGVVGIFTQYLAEQFGGDFLVKTLKNSSFSGVESVEKALASANQNKTFVELFRDFVLAAYLNRSDLRPEWGFKNKGLAGFNIKATGAFGGSDQFKTNFSFSVKDWSARVFEVYPGKEGAKVSFTFDPQFSDFAVYYLANKKDGKKELSEAKIIQGKGGFTFLSKDSDSIVLIPISKKKTTGFSDNELPHSFLLELNSDIASAVEPPLVEAKTEQKPQPQELPVKAEIQAPQMPVFEDGALIRAKDDFKVYIIKGKFRRHIKSAKIFDFYPHLGFSEVIEVEPEVLNFYTESNLIRFVNDAKVYEVSDDLRKHWLKGTPQRFLKSGKSFDAVFIINKKELNFYRIGKNILF